MSFMGAGSFGNYDLTAKMTGSPLDRTATHDQEEEVPPTTAGASSTAQGDDVTKTQATSVTEGAGASDTAGDDGDDSEAASLERRHSVVQALARTFTSQSQAVAPGTNPFLIASEDENSPLNPNGPNFNARAWAKALVNLVAGENNQFRTTGVAFQNLNVHGFGSATDFQKDVLNIWLEAVGLVRKLTGTGQTRIDILRDFNGLVRNGEMLVVLGPPGSGCTTFLKTIAGEHNGIYIDEKSYFNYQGE
jgi:ATP-binding cassette subfamily G (WHITE) protein 2 (PDR)